MNEEGILKIVDDAGIEKEFYILFTFDLEETKKSYVVYTDYSKDEQGMLKTFASTYTPDLENSKLEPVSTPEELEVIDAYLKKIEADIRFKHDQVIEEE